MPVERRYDFFTNFTYERIEGRLQDVDWAPIEARQVWDGCIKHYTFFDSFYYFAGANPGLFPAPGKVHTTGGMFSEMPGVY